MGSMEEYNYWNDSRVIESMKSKLCQVVRSNDTETVVRFDQDLKEQLHWDGLISNECYKSNEFTIPTTFKVCECCSGSGKVANPSVDASGLCDDDPEFMERYMAGAYDITCPACKGNRVVPVVDLGPDLNQAIRDWEEEEERYARMCAAERAFGC
jgi:hypothetical protein